MHANDTAHMHPCMPFIRSTRASGASPHTFSHADSGHAGTPAIHCTARPAAFFIAIARHTGSVPARALHRVPARTCERKRSIVFSEPADASFYRIAQARLRKTRAHPDACLMPFPSSLMPRLLVVAQFAQACIANASGRPKAAARGGIGGWISVRLRPAPRRSRPATAARRAAWHPRFPA